MLELVFVVLFWLPGINNPQIAGFKSAKEVCKFQRENKKFSMDTYRVYFAGNVLFAEPKLAHVELVCE